MSGEANGERGEGNTKKIGYSLQGQGQPDTFSDLGQNLGSPIANPMEINTSKEIQQLPSRQLPTEEKEVALLSITQTSLPSCPPRTSNENFV